MKRFAFVGILACLLLLSSNFFAVARAHSHTTAISGTQTMTTPSSISLPRLKALVSQTLGQQAANRIGRRITHPLGIRASTSSSLSLSQAPATTPAITQASAQEEYADSSTVAGYQTDAEGVSWVQGTVGFFNVASPTLLTTSVDTVIGVESNNSSITLGVDQLQKVTYLGFLGGVHWNLFYVNTNDRMDALILLDTNTNQWLLFIEDLTTGVSYGSEFSYDTEMIRALWLTGIGNDGPVPSMPLIAFTNSQWLSNWDGWQPIISSAAATYTQFTLLDPNGGQIWPTEIPDPPATFFTLVPCPTCS